MTARLDDILARLDGILSRAEALVGAPGGAAPVDGARFDAHWAIRWEKYGRSGRIVPVLDPAFVELSDLVGSSPSRRTSPSWTITPPA